MKLAIWFDENDFARLTRADEHLAETYAANSIDDNDAYDSAKWECIYTLQDMADRNPLLTSAFHAMNDEAARTSYAYTNGFGRFLFDQCIENGENVAYNFRYYVHIVNDRS